MQCPLIKTKNGVGMCKLKGDCILLKRAEDKTREIATKGGPKSSVTDVECFDLNETDYQEMQKRVR